MADSTRAVSLNSVVIQRTHNHLLQSLPVIWSKGQTALVYLKSRTRIERYSYIAVWLTCQVHAVGISYTALSHYSTIARFINTDTRDIIVVNCYCTLSCAVQRITITCLQRELNGFSSRLSDGILYWKYLHRGSGFTCGDKGCPTQDIIVGISSSCAGTINAVVNSNATSRCRITQNKIECTSYQTLFAGRVGTDDTESRYIIILNAHF